ncbi:MAG TPA: hypothetical protein VGL97_16920 [Bryobacteraceae bacterium]
MRTLERNYSQLSYRPKEAEPFEPVIFGHYHWLPLKFGKYGGRSLPVLFFTDLNYFFWGVENNQFHGRLRQQAIIVAARAQQIKPPRSGNWEFIVRIGSDGQLDAVSVGRALKTPISNLHRINRFNHLDVSIICQFGRKRRVAAKTMLAFLSEEFFDGKDPTDRNRSCESFFENDDNFALTCRDRHVLAAPKSPRTD